MEAPPAVSKMSDVMDRLPGDDAKAAALPPGPAATAAVTSGEKGELVVP